MKKIIYFKIPFTKISISLLAVMEIIALLYADFSPFTFAVLICAVLHELGHITAIHVFGGKIYVITILPCGGIIHSDMQKLPFFKMGCIAVAGILTNLIFAVVSWIFHLINGDIYSMFFAFCNFFSATVNLIPAKTFDGARVLEAFLYSKYSTEKAETILQRVSYFSFAVLCVFSLLLLWLTKCNFSLLILCVYLFISLYSGENI